MHLARRHSREVSAMGLERLLADCGVADWTLVDPRVRCDDRRRLFVAAQIPHHFPFHVLTLVGFESILTLISLVTSQAYRSRSFTTKMAPPKRFRTTSRVAWRRFRAAFCDSAVGRRSLPSFRTRFRTIRRRWRTQFLHSRR